MNKILVKRLLQKPTAWPACAKVVVAIVMRRKEVVIRRQGVKLRAKIGSGQGLYCAVAGTSYEPEMSYFLNRMQPGDTFIDVGANIGNFSLHACRRIQPTGKVYSFEPLQETFKDLQANIQLNGAQNIEAFKIALSDKKGSFTMKVPSRNSSAILVQSKGEVITETLDGFCARNHISEPQFIKVDIEGGELDFFHGAQQVLQRSAPLILFESMHSGPKYPERSFLREIGFELYRFTGLGMEVLSDDSSWSGNVLALKV
jgi:FkbM family methyltransferase